MSRTRVIIVCMAALLCIASVTAPQWVQALGWHWQHVFVAIGILELALFIRIVFQCRLRRA
jgi:hypothetical protein